MNEEEGKRALREAKQKLAANKINEGLKYLKISQRLHPSSETQELISRYSNINNNNNNSQSSSQSSTSNYSNEIILIIKNQFNILLEKFLQLETKYINPSMKNYIRGLFLAIFILIIVKYGFKQKIGFGSLPGDISYHSSNVYFSSPIISSLLLSFVVNGLFRFFRTP